MTATSGIGKQLFKKFVDKETLLLLESFTTLITKECGAKQAKKVKNDIIKIAVKVLVLYDSKKLTEESFRGLGFFFRRICSTVKNAYLRKELNEDTFQRLQSLVKEFELGIRNILKAYVSETTIKRIKDTFEFFQDKTFMLKISKQPEFEKIVHVLAHYLEAS